MKILTRMSLAMIAIPLVAMLWSARWMILFVQPERAEIAAGRLRFMFSYENYVHEAGFARLVLSIVGLLILFIPYRKGRAMGDRSSWHNYFRLRDSGFRFRRYSESRHLAGISKLAYGAHSESRRGPAV
ncbi:MAG: hypothetical protein WBP92_08360 [Candidatus Acidiferrales bacterium]